MRQNEEPAPQRKIPHASVKTPRATTKTRCSQKIIIIEKINIFLKFQRTEIIQSILSDHSKIKLGINNKNIGKSLFEDYIIHFQITQESKEK